jgi:hypothetical protein
MSPSAVAYGNILFGCIGAGKDECNSYIDLLAQAATLQAHRKECSSCCFFGELIKCIAFNHLRIR